MTEKQNDQQGASAVGSELSGGLSADEDLITCLWCGSSTPHETAVGACCWEEWKRQMDELATLVRMLVHQIRKTNPDNKTAAKAVDYLKRTNLQGSILRG